jgi:hypothetical protein
MRKNSWICTRKWKSRNSQNKLSKKWQFVGEIKTLIRITSYIVHKCDFFPGEILPFSKKEICLLFFGLNFTKISIIEKWKENTGSHPEFRIRGSISFTGIFLPNFGLKNKILTYTKHFSWQNWPKFARFRFLKFQIARVLWWLPQGSQEYKSILFLFYLISIM